MFKIRFAKDDHAANNAAQIEINKQYLKDLREREKAEKEAEKAGKK